MLEQRERGATNQAVIDARLVADSLSRGSADLPALLVGFTGEPDTAVLLHIGGRWTSAGRQVDVGAIPPILSTPRRARPRPVNA